MEKQPESSDQESPQPPVSDGDGLGFVEEPTLPPSGGVPEDSRPPQGDTSVVSDLDAPTVRPGAPLRDPSDDPAVAVTQEVSPKPGSDSKQSLPREFGDYELIEEIARGGMGVVFRARQRQLNRIVAIKMILTGQLAREEDIARFYTEAEAAASLDHPGIVPIYEVGVHEGQHFFSMGFVEGPSLAQLILERPLEPDVASELARQVAVAVGYAHSRGVIHRDLKPANVLVARDESSPRDAADSSLNSPGAGSIGRWGSGSGKSALSCGVAKVTDFGLAKNVEQQSELTATGQILGTPGYMPPEQAAGRLDEVDAIADVYSIGGILYALLTGRAPFQAATPLDTLMQVLEREPVAPRQLNAGVPADLETICLKCLQKDPKRRYESAAALVDDLTRFLQGEPIEARPVTRLERVWRWARRHPAVAGFATTTALLIGVIAAIAPLVAIRQSQLRVAEQTARIKAVEVSEDLADANNDAEANLYAARVKLAYQHFLDGSLPLMRKTLNEAPNSHRSWEWDFVSGLSRVGRLVLRGHPGEVGQVRFLTDDQVADTQRSLIDAPRLLTVGNRLDARTWDLSTGLSGGRIPVATKNTVMDDSGRRSISFIENVALVFDHQRIRVSMRFSMAGAPVIATTISGDGTHVAVLRRTAADEFCLHVHDAASGETLAGPWVMDPINDPLLSMDQDGQRLALADLDVAAEASARIRIWIRGNRNDEDATSSKGRSWRLAVLESDSTPTALTWADRERDADRLLIGDGRGLIRVYDFGDDEGTPISKAALVESVASVSGDQPFLKLSGGGAGILGLAFDSESGRLAAACADRRIAVWDDFQSTTRSLLCGLGARPKDLAFSRGGRYLAAGSEFGASVWRLPAPGTLPIRQETEEVLVSPRPLGDMALSEAGEAYVVDRAGRVLRLEPETGELGETDFYRWLTGRQTIPGQPPPEHDATIPGRLAISPDGRMLALSVSRLQQSQPAAASRRILSSVVLWDRRSRRPAGVLGEQNNVITGIAFSPSGDRIATVTGLPETTRSAIARDDRMGNSIRIEENDLRVWDVASGQVLASGRERAGSFTAVHWPAEDSRLMIASENANLESVKASDLSVVSEIEFPVSLRAEDMVTIPAVTASVPDQDISDVVTWIAVAFTDGQIRLYDLDTGELVRTLVGHADAVQSLHYDPVRDRLFSGGRDATVRVWEPDRGLEVLMLPTEGAAVSDVGLTGDGNLLTTAADGSLRIWRPGSVLTEVRNETGRWRSLAQTRNAESDDQPSADLDPGAGADSSAGKEVAVWDPPEAWRTQIGKWKIEPGRLTAVTASAGSRQGDQELALARAQLIPLKMPDTLEMQLRLKVQSDAGLQVHFRDSTGQEGEVVEFLSAINPFSQRRGIRVYAMSDLITARETTANSSVTLSEGQWHDVRLWRLPGELIVEVDGELAMVSHQPTIPEASLLFQPMYGQVGAQVVIEDLEIRSSVDAIKRVEVAGQVVKLFERLLLTDWVQREIDQHSDWSIELKRYAQSRLAGLSEDPEAIGDRLDAFLRDQYGGGDQSSSEEADQKTGPEEAEDPRWLTALARWQVEQDPNAAKTRELADVMYAAGDHQAAADAIRRSIKIERKEHGIVSTESLWTLATMEYRSGRTQIAKTAARRALKIEQLDASGESSTQTDAKADPSRGDFFRAEAVQLMPDLVSDQQATDKQDSAKIDPLVVTSLKTWLDVWRGGALETLRRVAADDLTANWSVQGDPDDGYTLSSEELLRNLEFERQNGEAKVERTVQVEDYEVARRGEIGGVRATVAIQTRYGYDRCQWTFRLKRVDDQWRLVSITDRLLSESEADRTVIWDANEVTERRSELPGVDAESMAGLDDSTAMLRRKLQIARSLRDLKLAESLLDDLLARDEAIARDWLDDCLVKMWLGKTEEAKSAALRALDLESNLSGPPLLAVIRSANSDGSSRQPIGAGLTAEIPSGWRQAGREMFLAPGDFLSGWFLRGNTAMLVMRVPQQLTPETIRAQMQQFGQDESRRVLQIEDRKVGELDAVEVMMEGAGNGGMIDGRGSVLTRQFNQFLFREKDVIILTVVCPAADWDEIAPDITAVTDSLQYDPED